MKSTKIQVAFAEDIEEHRKRIVIAIQQTKKYELSIKAVSGRDLILKLKRARKLPAIVLMDMQMPCCDGLLATIICKWLFPQIKIVGLSNHTDGVVVSEFYTEGGDTFLSKYIIIKTALTQSVYNDENIFEKALDQVINTTEKFIDVMLEDNGTKFTNRLSTTHIIAKNHSHLKDYEIAYLQLNAAGFSRAEIAELMNRSESTIQKYFNHLSKYFNVENHNDLNNISINLGIAKLVCIYQPQPTLCFD